MKAVKRAIIICWIMLIVCFIIKLVGGNWFEIICDNKHFINICNYIDTHAVLRYCMGFPIYAISTYFILLACCLCVKPNWKQTLTIFIFIICVWATQFIHQYVKLIFEIVMFLVLPFIIRIIQNGKTEWKQALKKTWYLGIVGYIIDLTFQLLSLLTRNIGIKIIENNSLLSLILMIDYYIMIAIFYLYVILKIKNKEK